MSLKCKVPNLVKQFEIYERFLVIKFKTGPKRSCEGLKNGKGIRLFEILSDIKSHKRFENSIAMIC